jgi:O-antigen ligase
LAAWTSTVIPFCFAMALTLSGRWRTLAFAACGLCLAGLVGSQVRAGIAGVVIGLGVVLVLYQFSRGFSGLHLGATALAVLAVVAAGAVILSNPAQRHRYQNILKPGQDQAFVERTYKWNEAVTDIARHPYGHGLGTAGTTQVHLGRFSTLGTYDIDNSYLKIALDQGIAVTILYASALLMLLGGLARRALLTTAPERAGPAIGACGALASFIVIIFTAVYIEGLTALALWVIVGLGVAQFASTRAGEEGNPHEPPGTAT